MNYLLILVKIRLFVRFISRLPEIIISDVGKKVCGGVFYGLADEVSGKETGAGGVLDFCKKCP